MPSSEDFEKIYLPVIKERRMWKTDGYETEAAIFTLYKNPYGPYMYSLLKKLPDKSQI